MTVAATRTSGAGLSARTKEHAAPRAAPLPCLSSNKCNDDPEKAARLHRLTSQHRKTAVALSMNVAALAERHGIERLGFLTLTFADHVLDPKEAQRRFKSLRTGVLSDRYQGFIRVFERQKSGRIHYHLLIALDADIRTGVDFAAFARGDYRSASPELRAEWAFWRRTAKAYGFGRTELMPIRSTHEGIARYVGKYISKHIDQREERDKGVRLADYSRGARIANTKFSWASPGARQWRAKLAIFAKTMFHAGRLSSPTYQGLRAGLGPKWAYHWKDFILSLPDIDDSHAPSDEPRPSPRVVPASLGHAAHVGIEPDRRDCPRSDRRTRGPNMEPDRVGDRGRALAGDDPGWRDRNLPADLERTAIGDGLGIYFDRTRRRFLTAAEIGSGVRPVRLAGVRYPDQCEASGRLSPPS